MIHFVGAGPGAPDLITVRGARLLKEADVIIYAGSLVNPELLEFRKPTCTVFDSASMTLEETIQVMRDAQERGLECVRLHTGDPSLYGAIAEQMTALDAVGIDYDVVPGVSSLFGAAAALKTEYTLPGVSQSLIVTRAAGRTPVPDRERLSLLAAHGCTMALFLSTGLLAKAQTELLAGGYAPQTPAAIVYRATWPDEAVYRCTVATLADCAKTHGITKTALVIVGDALDGHGERSKLYDPEFSHGYRAAHGVVNQQRTQSVSVVAFTARGLLLARQLAEGLAGQGHVVDLSAPMRLATNGVSPFGNLSDWARDAFSRSDALIFVSACGIAVRTIAPYATDKFRDPAVICIDETARFVIPLLSGHVGGANALARTIAGLCGAQPVITTATDVNGVFAVDEWAARQGLVLLDRVEARHVATALLEGKTVGLTSTIPLEGPLPQGLACGEEADSCEVGISISLDAALRPFAATLRLVPRVATVGIGCKRGTAVDELEAALEVALSEAHLAREAVRELVTIDVKQDELGILDLGKRLGVPVRFQSAEQLAAVPGNFSSSAFVKETVGVDNVCERAACATGGTLVLGRRRFLGITAAIALHETRLSVVGWSRDKEAQCG